MTNKTFKIMSENLTKLFLTQNFFMVILYFCQRISEENVLDISKDAWASLNIRISVYMPWGMGRETFSWH